MSLYSSNEEVKETGGSYEAGLYKFRVTSSELHSNGAIKFSIECFDGPEKVLCWLNINSEKKGAIDEVNRRLTILLGKTSIDDAKELVGKEGYVVLYKKGRFLEPMPFGAFYNIHKMSVCGKDSSEAMVKRAIIESEKATSTNEPAKEVDEDDMPF